MNPRYNGPIRMPLGFADNHRINKTPYDEVGGDVQRAAALPAMESVVTALMIPGKGLFAADGCIPTGVTRFSENGAVSTEEKWRAYRKMLFTALRLSDYISGVILYDETIHQCTGTGTTMPELLASIGIIPGIKADVGTVPLANCPGETMTQGLDGLRERLLEYRRIGAWFTTWRAVLFIADEIPSRGCIAANATQLALFAALSQEAGLVPIVEPDLIMHSMVAIDRCEEVTKVVLTRVFDAMSMHRVDCTRLLLTTGMVHSGSECPEPAGIDRVAETTIRCLHDTVPTSVPGIVFQSDGQGEDQATERLNAICHTGRTPWPMSFSCGRTLQSSAFRLWNGGPSNTSAAQTELLRRAQQNSRAATGAADAAESHR